MDRKKIEKTAWLLFEVEEGEDATQVAEAIWAQQKPKNKPNDRWVVRADVVQGLDPWRIVVPVVGVHEKEEDKAKAKIKKVVAEVKTVTGVKDAEILWVTQHCPERDMGYKPAKRGHNAWG